MNTVNESKLSPRDLAVEKIVELLEKNPTAWKKTWEVIGNPTSRPFNPISGTCYKGVNMFMLGLTATTNGFEDNRWCTYEQAKSKNHQVSRGESSKAIVVYHLVNHTLIVREKQYQIKDKTETEVCKLITGIAVKNYPSEKNAIENVYEQCILSESMRISKSELLTSELKNKLGLDVQHYINTYARYTPIFNYSQMNNVPAQEIVSGYSWNPCDRAEHILKSSGVPIYHDQVSKNYYRPGIHDIHLTIKASFQTPEAYYATALHELSHAKINDGSVLLSFDPQDYNMSHVARSKEELRAELSSIFICADIGLNYDVQNHAAYLHSWLNIIKNDKTELWTAISESNRISDAIFKCEQDYLNKLTVSEIKASQNDKIETNSINNDEVKVLSSKISLPNFQNELSR